MSLAGSGGQTYLNQPCSRRPPRGRHLRCSRHPPEGRHLQRSAALPSVVTCVVPAALLSVITGGGPAALPSSIFPNFPAACPLNPWTLFLPASGSPPPHPRQGIRHPKPRGGTGSGGAARLRGHVKDGSKCRGDD